MVIFRWTTSDRVRLLWAASLAAILCGRGSAADNPVLATAYGTGVHAYHAGDYQRTYDDLTTVIEGGSNDPRAFYFRGLAAIKLGRLDEAEADFATGAAREAAALGTWNVPRSLERVQGEDRLRLERHRSRARVVLAQQRREALVRRYAEIDAAQESVLRRRRPETVPAREVGPAPAEEAIEETAEEPAEPAEAPAEPEMDEESAAEEPDGEDEPAAEGDSPFGDDAPAGKEAASEDAPAADETESEPAEAEADADADTAEEEPADEEEDAAEAEADAAE